MNYSVFFFWLLLLKFENWKFGNAADLDPLNTPLPNYTFIISALKIINQWFYHRFKSRHWQIRKFGNVANPTFNCPPPNYHRHKPSKTFSKQFQSNNREFSKKNESGSANLEFRQRRISHGRISPAFSLPAIPHQQLFHFHWIHTVEGKGGDRSDDSGAI